MSTSLCDKCSAICCRYFALPLDNPTTAKDLDDVRWYLLHRGIHVFIEKKQWYLCVHNPCEHLGAANRCGIYDRRPRICRKYSTRNCEFHGGEYNFSKLFKSAADLEAYADEYLASLNKPRRKKRARPKRNGRSKRAL